MRAIVSQHGMWWRSMRHWRKWLRRNAGYAALLLLSIFILLEPLGCIAHCQLWAALRMDSAASAQHAHHHGMSHAAVSPGNVTPGPAHGHALHRQPGTIRTATPLGIRPDTSASPLRAHETCSMAGMHGALSDVPFGSTLAPLHEHLAVLFTLAFLAIVPLIRRAPRGPPRPSPQFAYRPPLRPPILLIVSR